MKLEKSINFIFKECSRRIGDKKNDLKITASKIYPNDPSLISKIINYNRTKNNRYLICDAILYNISSDGVYCGIVPSLEFRSKNEALWGNEYEIKKYLPTLFRKIIEDLLNEYDNQKTINDFFLDYIPYAKYSAFYEILFNEHKNNLSFIQAYGIYEDDVVENYLNLYDDKKEIINYLYKKCYLEFYNNFLSFVDETDSFHKINKVISSFVTEKFIPMLEDETNSSKSLGMRVHNLILNDLTKSEELLTSKSLKTNDLSKEYPYSLINVSSKYITELEEIQEKQVNDFYKETIKKQSHI